MVRAQREEEEEETHTDIWTEPVRTSLPVLESASDFQIIGGSISSFAGDSTSFTARRDVHVTINHHHSPSPTSSVSSSSSNSINHPDICADQGPEDVSSAHSRTHGLSSDTTAQFNLSVQRNCDVYRQHLATKGRGLPLWNPEPGHTLPIQYQRQGISMGDVGVVTASGSFAFLFNIFLPKNHPINPPIMPEGFKPLKFIQGFDTVPSQRDLKDNSYLASPSSIQARRDRSAANFIFESSEYDGGILTIPVGAKSEDLACLGRLRKYVATKVMSWYRYACLRRGMEIQNGDLKVVTGCDKTSAWGMACLSSSARPRSASSSSRGSGEERRFYLEFGPTEGGGCLNQRGGRYEWAYSGEVAEVRAGPDACEVAQLRMARGDGEVEGLEGDTEHHENQCLFLRTMNATLPEEAWQELMLEEEEEEEDDEATWEEEEADVDPRYAHRSFGYRGNADGRSGISGQGSSTIRGGVRRNLSSIPPATVNNRGPLSATPLSRTNIAVDASDMASDFPSRLTSLADHPSIAINRCLLQNSSPQTKMAISVDQDWVSVLREDDVILPSSDELLKRIFENYRICENDGVVFLESKHTDEHTNELGIITSTELRNTDRSNVHDSPHQQSGYKGTDHGPPPVVHYGDSHSFMRQGDVDLTFSEDFITVMNSNSRTTEVPDSTPPNQRRGPLRIEYFKGAHDYEPTNNFRATFGRNFRGSVDSFFGGGWDPRNARRADAYWQEDHRFGTQSADSPQATVHVPPYPNNSWPNSPPQEHYQQPTYRALDVNDSEDVAMNVDAPASQDHGDVTH